MVFKRSEYRRQFKISTLEKNIPSYLERVNYRELRKQREYSHTPISWDAELLDSEESDEKLTPEEEVKQLPVSDLAITEEEGENEEDSEGEIDSVEREKKVAHEKEKTGDDVVITKQDDELRKSAKEKLSKYTFKENKDDPSQAKDAGPSISKSKCKAVLISYILTHLLHDIILKDQVSYIWKRKKGFQLIKLT